MPNFFFLIARKSKEKIFKILKTPKKKKEKRKKKKEKKKQQQQHRGLRLLGLVTYIYSIEL